MLGFFLLAVLLFFSGAMSFVELKRLSASTEEVIETRLKNMQLSHIMLDALHRQDMALTQMLISGDPAYGPGMIAGRGKFDEALKEAAILVRDIPMVDTIYYACLAYNNIVDKRIAARNLNDGDIEWFSGDYINAYSNLRAAINIFNASAQDLADSSATQLESDAYRAITPGIITLGIAILIILMFFYFIDFYYIKPVIRITSGLDKYLNFKTPFKVAVEGRDEVARLKEEVEELVERLKQKDN